MLIKETTNEYKNKIRHILSIILAIYLKLDKIRLRQKTKSIFYINKII